MRYCSYNTLIQQNLSNICDSSFAPRRETRIFGYGFLGRIELPRASAREVRIHKTLGIYPNSAFP